MQDQLRHILAPNSSLLTPSLSAVVLVLLAISTPGWGQSYNLLSNGGFETTEQDGAPSDWRGSEGARTVEDVRRSGRRSLLLPSQGGTLQDCWRVAPGRTYTCSAWVKLEDVEPTEPPGYAYLAAYQYDHRRNLIAYHDFMHGTGTQDWRRFTYTFAVPENVRYASIRCGLFRAKGKLWVDDFVLVDGESAPESAADLPEMPIPKDIGRGRIAILKDDTPVVGSASSPDYLAEVLRAKGYGVTMVDCDGLCDPSRFDRRSFELLILPYGASFPMEAEAPLQRFLQSGGDFLSMGGYAFDNLIVRKDGRWTSYVYNLDHPDSPELAGNPGFEGEEGWEVSSKVGTAIVELKPHSGRKCAEVVQENANSVTWFQWAPVEVGKEYQFSGWLRTEGVVSGVLPGFAYLAVYQHDKDGKLTDFRDVVHLKGTNDWKSFRYQFVPRQGTVRARLIGGLYSASGKVWIDDVSLRVAPARVCINTRHGNAGDGLSTLDTQIGVFDPSYELRRVKCATATPGQLVLDPALRIEGELTGYAACGVTGYDNARWSSLLVARDRYGRRRGSVGAMMRNYKGVFRRSTWAYFGATNRDLFPRGDEQMKKALADLVGNMMLETYLHNLKTDQACYQVGEKARLSAAVSNFGWAEQNVVVRFEICPTSSQAAFVITDRPQSLPPIALSVPAGKTESVNADVEIAGPISDFCVVRAELSKEDKVIDRIHTGFVVANGEMIRSGPPIQMRDNYLSVRGKTHVMLCTDTYSDMFRSQQHNPMTWARDIRKCADFGISIFENLQVGPQAFDPPYKSPKEWYRQVDAMAQLCQANDSIYLPCLLCGYNTVASDEEMKAQAEYSRDYAQRYRHVPGIAYYVNGDLSFRWIDSPDITRLWNDFLRKKYGTDEKLREAWSLAPPEAKLGEMALDKNRGAKGWADIRACDFHEFEIALVERWIKSQHEACRAGDPDHPTTVEYYQRPYGGMDMRRSINGLDLGNIGYFGPPREDMATLPSILKFNDLRLIGKGLSVGEFGVKTHPAWSPEEGYPLDTYHVTRSEAEQNRLFLTLPHYVLGMGGCKMHNWCWRDANERVFPWGLNYPCDVLEKDCLLVYRNVGLLFRQFEPLYRPPQLCLLVPDQHMLGGSAARVEQAVLNAMDTLIDLHVDFAPLGEAHIDRLPKETKTILYPIPFCIPDRVYDKLRQFVGAGGCLYLSGDFSYDGLRRRTKAERLQELAGITFPAPKEIYARPEGVAPLVTKGTVMMRTDPIELSEERDSEALRDLYRGFLDKARATGSGATGSGIAREPVLPDDPSVHVFTLPTRDGGALTTLINTDTSKTKTVRYGEDVELGLGPLEPGLVFRSHRLTNGRGELAAIEAFGRFVCSGIGLVEGDGHFVLFSIDGRDVRTSPQLAFMPFDVGSFRIRATDALAPAEMQIGEVRDATWHSFESLQPQRKAGMLEVTVDEDRRFGIFLIGPAGMLDDLGKHVAQVLTTP